MPKTVPQPVAPVAATRRTKTQRAVAPPATSSPNVEGAAPGAAEPAVQVLRQFRVVFNAVRTHFQQMEKQVGVGGALVWALSEIQRTPGLGMNDLARAMDIHQSTASNLVRQLLKRGLVRIEKSTVDRRSIHLHLEPSALPLLRRVPGPHQGLMPDALRQLPPEVLAQLSVSLGQLIPLLKADEAGAAVPLAQL